MMPRNNNDILKRIIFNLEYIKKNKDVDGPFEVTQLMNSFLMAVIQKWDELKKDWQGKNRCVDMKKIRDALAHGNISFEADQKKEIAAIHLWTCPLGKDEVDWDYKLDIKQLRNILYEFVDFAKDNDLPNRKPMKKGDVCKK